MALEVAAAGPWRAAAVGGTYLSLGALDDEQLVEFARACQQVAAWAGGMLLGAVAELADRRPDDRFPGRAAAHADAAKKASAAAAKGQPADPPPWDEFAADELAAVLRLSRGGATRQIALGQALRYRLHGTQAALLAGTIDVVRARIIFEATDVLSAQDAAAVEEMVLPRAGRQTYVTLGMALGKAVLTVDPEGAMRRRKKAEKRARVERWREPDGTGALAGRNLPPEDTLAADQALTGQALALREAGLDGPLDFLRAMALIDRITGRDSRPPVAAPHENPDRKDSHDDRSTEADSDDEEDWEDREDWPVLDRQHLEPPDEPPSAPQDPVGSDQEDRRHVQSGDGDRPGRGRPRRGRRRRGQMRIKARMTVTVPARTLLGLGDAPGDAEAFGPLDGGAARDLARTAAAHRETRWCVTVIDDHGHAIGHGCARGPQEWLSRAGPRGPGGSELVRDLVDRLGVTIMPIARGSCDHLDQVDRYRPGRMLRHRVHARSPRCSYWGCRRPADDCDDDHTLAWERGGRTCQCNLAPLCRRHHRMKQQEGWLLEQPEPGLMRWRTPGGLRFSTGPAHYIA